MKTKLISIISLLVILSSSIYSQKEKSSTKITIKEARRVFVGKTVRIFSKADSDGKLSYWHYADKKDTTYKRRPSWSGRKYESTNLPISYRWQKAVVVAIEFHENSIPKRNALGEILDSEKSILTQVYVFVKFPDGTLAGVSNSLETLLGQDLTYERKLYGIEERLEGWKTFMLTSELTKRSMNINSKINSIIGKVVFATAQSKLYPISSPLLELIDNKTQINDFPYLEPLTIKTAKYNEEADVIILKLQDKSGKLYLTFSNYVPRKQVQDFFETIIFWRIHPNLYPKIPQYTEKEITAIKSRTVFVGMNVVCAYDSLGSPEGRDSLRNPEKGKSLSKITNNILFYSNGKLRVNIDIKTLKVVDIEDNR